jgi:hypothetical protein
MLGVVPAGASGNRTANSRRVDGFLHSGCAPRRQPVSSDRALTHNCNLHPRLRGVFGDRRISGRYRPACWHLIGPSTSFVYTCTSKGSLNDAAFVRDIGWLAGSAGCCRMRRTRATQARRNASGHLRTVRCAGYQGTAAQAAGWQQPIADGSTRPIVSENVRVDRAVRGERPAARETRQRSPGSRQRLMRRLRAPTNSRSPARRAKASISRAVDSSTSAALGSVSSFLSNSLPMRAVSAACSLSEVC